MIRVDTYLGRRETLGVADAGTIRLDADDRRRSRVRTTAESGQDVGVVIGRRLRTGDVIAGDGHRFVVEIDPVDALAIDLGDVDPVATLELGHAIGNRHWGLAVEDGVAIVPIAESADRTREQIAAALPETATVTERSVSPALLEDSNHDHSGPAHGGADDDRHHEHAGHDRADHGHAVDRGESS